MIDGGHYPPVAMMATFYDVLAPYVAGLMF